MTDTRTPTILPDLSQQLAQMQAMIAAQAAEIARLSAARSTPMHLRLGWKGTVILSGVNGKFGAAFYAKQWEDILDKADEIRAFILANPTLPRKADGDVDRWQAAHPELKPKDA